MHDITGDQAEWKYTWFKKMLCPNLFVVDLKSSQYRSLSTTISQGPKKCNNALDQRIYNLHLRQKLHV